MSISVESPALGPLLDIDFPQDLKGAILEKLSVTERSVVHIAADLLLSEKKIDQAQANHLHSADPNHFLVEGGHLRGDKLTYPYLLRMGRTNLYLNQRKEEIKFQSHRGDTALSPFAALNALPDRHIAPSEFLGGRPDSRRAIAKKILEIAKAHEEQELEEAYPDELDELTASMTAESNPRPILSTTGIIAMLIGSSLRKARHNDLPKHLDELFSGEPQNSEIFNIALSSLPERLRGPLRSHPFQNLRGLLFCALPILFVFQGDEASQLRLSQTFFNWTLQREGREDGLVYLADALTKCNRILTERLFPECLRAMENMNDFVLPKEIRTGAVFCRFLLTQNKFAGDGTDLPWLRGVPLRDASFREVIYYSAYTDHLEALKSFFRHFGIGQHSFLNYKKHKLALGKAVKKGRVEVVQALFRAITPKSLRFEEFERGLPVNAILQKPCIRPSDVRSLAVTYLLLEYAEHSPALCNHPKLQQSLKKLAQERVPPFLTKVQEFLDDRIRCAKELMNEEEEEKWEKVSLFIHRVRALRNLEEAPTAAPRSGPLSGIRRTWTRFSDHAAIRAIERISEQPPPSAP